MKCEVIQDLLALYADNCCSEESRRIIEDHLQNCNTCRAALADMKTEPIITERKASAPIPALKRVSEWKASVLQSVVMFVCFLALVAGVSFEAYTPSGTYNGTWVLSIIIPVTAFLLSQINWYFMRLYKSKSVFSVCSLLLTLSLSLCGYIWAWLHYGLGAILSAGSSPLLVHLCVGIGLTAAVCVLSKLLSNRYAVMLGKE